MSETNYPYPFEKTKVIHLKGTDREIGAGHAEQVGSSVNLGMVKFYYEFWRRMSAVVPKSPLDRMVVKGLNYLIDRIVVKRLVRTAPEFALERLRGVAEVSGQPMENLITLLVLPDLLPLLQAFGAKLSPNMFVPVHLPTFGCSSFLHRGKHFLQGRNLDFPGVAYWDRYQVIQSVTQPKKLRYVGVSTAGVPLCGITGINEAQVSVALHQHYCRETSLKGQLPYVIAESLLAEAGNVKEAVEVLKRYRVATAWAFVVADGKTKEGFIYECHPKAHGIRWLTPNAPLLTHTNYFQTPACQPAEYAATARMNWDNIARKNRLDQLVRKAGFDLNPENAVSVLCDHYDPYWGEEKPFNRTISQVYNIQSLVIDLGAMKFYLAEGNAPIHLRSYREYDLGAIFRGERGEGETLYPAFRFADAGKQGAKEHYISSFIAAMDGDLNLAKERLERALESSFESETALTLAVVYMKLGDFAKPIPLLEKAKETLERKVRDYRKTCYPPEYFEIVLYLARAYDLNGRRPEALRLYRCVSTHQDLEDTNLKRLALAEGPYKAEKLDRVLMPYSTYIPFQ